MTYFLIILILIVLLVFWGISIYNKLVKNRNMMEEAFSGMDVQLKKRHDLIPNLVNTVKGYASHEQETFERVMEARSKAMGGMSLTASNAETVADTQNQLTSALGRLFAVAENYPELKADANFRELQTQLSTLQSKNLSYEEQMSSINSIFRTDISPRVSIHILTLQSKWGKIESTYGVIPHQKLEKEVEAVFAKKYGEQHKEGTLTDVLVSADCGWRFYLCAAGITAAAIICHSSCSSAAVVATAGLGIPACLLLCGTIQIAGFAECDDRYC